MPTNASAHINRQHASAYQILGTKKIAQKASREFNETMHCLQRRLAATIEQYEH